MEWSGSKQAKNDTDIQMVLKMMDFMYHQNYKPYKPGLANLPDTNELPRENWKNWPFDVLWKHSLFET